MSANELMIADLRFMMTNSGSKMDKAVDEISPRESSRTRRSGGATRDAIFEAALRLFRQRGFHGTSINDIGAAAGVTGPALYRHFSGKADVPAQAMREGASRIAAATKDAVTAEGLPPERALEGLVRAYVGVALDNPDIYAAYVMEARHLASDSIKPLRELRQRDHWVRMIQQVNPELSYDAAETLARMAALAVTSLCLEPNKLEGRELSKLAVSRVMALLAPTAPRP